MDYVAARYADPCPSPWGLYRSNSFNVKSLTGATRTHNLQQALLHHCQFCHSTTSTVPRNNNNNSLKDHHHVGKHAASVAMRREQYQLPHPTQPAVCSRAAYLRSGRPLQKTQTRDKDNVVLGVVGRGELQDTKKQPQIKGSASSAQDETSNKDNKDKKHEVTFELPLQERCVPLRSSDTVSPETKEKSLQEPLEKKQIQVDLDKNRPNSEGKDAKKAPECPTVHLREVRLKSTSTLGGGGLQHNGDMDDFGFLSYPILSNFVSEPPQQRKMFPEAYLKSNYSEGAGRCLVWRESVDKQRLFKQRAVIKRCATH